MRRSESKQLAELEAELIFKTTNSVSQPSLSAAPLLVLEAKEEKLHKVL